MAGPEFKLILWFYILLPIVVWPIALWLRRLSNLDYSDPLFMKKGISAKDKIREKFRVFIK